MSVTKMRPYQPALGPLLQQQFGISQIQRNYILSFSFKNKIRNELCPLISNCHHLHEWISILHNIFAGSDWMITDWLGAVTVNVYTSSRYLGSAVMLHTLVLVAKAADRQLTRQLHHLITTAHRWWAWLKKKCLAMEFKLFKIILMNFASKYHWFFFGLCWNRKLWK